MQAWYGNSKNPNEWGWKKSKFGLTPVTTTKDPAPEALLKFISCKCKKGSGAACSCRKAGLKCSIICSFCNGDSCDNVPQILADSENEENKDHIETTNIMEELSTLLNEKSEEIAQNEMNDSQDLENSQEDINQPGSSGFSKRLKRKH